MGLRLTLDLSFTGTNYVFKKSEIILSNAQMMDYQNRWV